MAGPSALLTTGSANSATLASADFFPGEIARVAGAGGWAMIGRILVLSCADLAALVAAGITGYLSWARIELQQPASLYAALLPLFVVFVCAYSIAGLYPGFGLGAVETLRRFFYSTTLSFLLLAAASFALKLDPVYSRIAFIIGWLSSLLFLPLTRFFVLCLASKLAWWQKPTILVGNARQVTAVMYPLENSISLGYRPIGILSNDRSQRGCAAGGLEVLGATTEAQQVSRSGVDTAIVWNDVEYTRGLDALQRYFRHVIVIQPGSSFPAEHVRVCNIGGILGIEFSNELLRRDSQMVKRAFDVIAGSLLCVIAVPIVLLSCLA